MPKVLTLSSAVIVAVWLVTSVPLEWLSETLREPLCDSEPDLVEVSEWVRVPEPETSPVRVAVLQGV